MVSIRIQKDNAKIDPRKTAVREAKSSEVPFRQLLQLGSQTVGNAELQALFKEIETQGERLSLSQSIRDVQAFKRFVHKFIQKAVTGGLRLEQSRSWYYGKGGTVHTLVKKIDEKLVALTDRVLEGQQSSIDLLNRIGEIKGLLINLYQ